MELKTIEYKLSVCKVTDISDINLTLDFYFVGKTDEELSLVCKTEDTPQNMLDFLYYKYNDNINCDIILV